MNALAATAHSLRATGACHQAMARFLNEAEDPNAFMFVAKLLEGYLESYDQDPNAEIQDSAAGTIAATLATVEHEELTPTEVRNAAFCLRNLAELVVDLDDAEQRLFDGLLRTLTSNYVTNRRKPLREALEAFCTAQRSNHAPTRKAKR